jgi:hypothetical protein
MRLAKPIREQRAAQYLITTCCVWDVEHRFDLDHALASAWDKGRFDDPYRRVLLPTYPQPRRRLCRVGRSACAVTRPGRPYRHGQDIPDYARP